MGKQHKKERKVYIVLNKPTGHRPPAKILWASNCVGFNKRKETRIYPGPFDFETEGLLLLTNDGIVICLTHPKYKVKKVYHVLVKEYLKKIFTNIKKRSFVG